MRHSCPRPATQWLMRQGPRVGRLAGALLIIWGAYVFAHGG